MNDPTFGHLADVGTVRGFALNMIDPYWHINVPVRVTLNETNEILAIMTPLTRKDLDSDRVATSNWGVIPLHDPAWKRFVAAVRDALELHITEQWKIPSSPTQSQA